MKSISSICLLSLFLIAAYSASAPIIWTSSNYFQTDTHTYIGSTSGPIAETVTVMYATSLTGPGDRRVALGLVDFDYEIVSNVLYFVLKNIAIGQAGFNGYNGLNIKNARFCYLVVDPSFPYPFSVNFFSGSSSTGLVGPFSETYYVNFTASTGVTMDMTHNNAMMAFQHIINATSASSCFEMQIQFFMANESFYQVTLNTTCEMTVYYWGFSRYIFDKTAIQSLGYCFFDYGEIEAYDNDDSSLSVSLQNFMANNFMYGLNSYSFSGQTSFTFDSILASTTTSTISIGYKQIKFMYWAFRFRTCSASYPYFNYDTMLCYDACDVRYYQNQPDKLCEPCYYSCYTCDAASPLQSCISCNQTTDFRVQNGSACEPIIGYYDNTTTEAAPCSDGCQICLDETQCQTCEDNLTVVDGFCQCIPVDIKNCDQCSDPLNCLRCNDGFSLVSGVCEYCSEKHCKTCSNKDICTQCKTDYQLDNGKCLCIPSDTNCQRCLTPTVCTLCKAGYGLNQAKSCQICQDPNSETCSSPELSVTCKQNKFLYEDWCYDNCPNNTKINEANCVKCLSQNCANEQEQEESKENKQQKENTFDDNTDVDESLNPQIPQQTDDMKKGGTQYSSQVFQMTAIALVSLGAFLCTLGCCCCLKSYFKLKNTASQETQEYMSDYDDRQ